MGLAALFRIERITSWKFTGVVFGIAGVWCAIGLDVDAPPDALRGDIIMAIGMACSAAYTVFAKRYVMKYDGVAMTAWSMLLGSGALFVLAMIFGSPFSGSLDLGVGVGSAAVSLLSGRRADDVVFHQRLSIGYPDTGGYLGGVQSPDCNPVCLMAPERAHRMGQRHRFRAGHGGGVSRDRKSPDKA